jgi:hypothetical protein
VGSIDASDWIGVCERRTGSLHITCECVRVRDKPSDWQIQLVSALLDTYSVCVSGRYCLTGTIATPYFAAIIATDNEDLRRYSTQEVAMASLQC